MASHKIVITVITQAAGVVTDQTGIMGLVMQGVAVGGQLVLDTPYSVNSLAGLAAFGITPAYDLANNVAVYQQMSEFLIQAGDGAQLWFQVTATTNNYTNYLASINFSNFVKYTQQADVSAQAKIIGICYAPPVTVQSATDFPADVTGAQAAGQTVWANLFAQGYCFGLIIDGYNMKSSATASTLTTQATGTSYAVSLCITGTKGNGVSSVGLALAVYARLSIGNGIGTVALGVTTSFLTNGLALYAGGTALTVANVYLVVGGTVLYNGVTYTTGQQLTCLVGFTTFTTPDTGYLVFNSTPLIGLGDESNGGIVGMSNTDIDILGTKQFFFFGPVPGISGLFWNDGATCTATTTFFCMMEYMRVACYLAYNARAFLQAAARAAKLPVDPATGNLDATWIQTKQKTFTALYVDPITNASGSGDIAGATFTINGVGYGASGQFTFAIVFVRNTINGPIVGTIGQSLTL